MNGDNMNKDRKIRLLQESQPYVRQTRVDADGVPTRVQFARYNGLYRTVEVSLIDGTTVGIEPEDLPLFDDALACENMYLHRPQPPFGSLTQSQLRTGWTTELAQLMYDSAEEFVDAYLAPRDDR